MYYGVHFSHIYNFNFMQSLKIEIWYAYWFHFIEGHVKSITMANRAHFLQSTIGQNPGNTIAITRILPCPKGTHCYSEMGWVAPHDYYYDHECVGRAPHHHWHVIGATLWINNNNDNSNIIFPIDTNTTPCPKHTHCDRERGWVASKNEDISYGRPPHLHWHIACGGKWINNKDVIYTQPKH